MIADHVVLHEIQEAWEFVRRARNIVVGNLNSATMAGRPQSAEFRSLCFNLLLASAFSVLEDTLKQFRGEGRISSKSTRLGDLMQGSQNRLPWREYSVINTGRGKRNSSIHDRTLIDHSECRDYIAAIERELAGWNILTSTSPELWHW